MSRKKSKQEKEEHYGIVSNGLRTGLSPDDARQLEYGDSSSALRAADTERKGRRGGGPSSRAGRIIADNNYGHEPFH